jgi:4a-hydroxytetrahydrobiopterin dehydratase
MEYTGVSAEDVAASPDLDDWRVVLGMLVADFRAESFGAAAAFVSAIAAAADAAGHHPDLDVRYPGHVRVSLMTHAIRSLSTHDIGLARTISALAADAGVRLHPGGGQALEVTIDTMDEDRIRPFWAAVLGYEDLGWIVVDPLRIGPRIWFQEMDEPREQRNRIHLDISVPHDVADERITAALQAGGTLVSDSAARAWWVLADADGNEACITTWQDR